jgi:hypothetical protein
VNMVKFMGLKIKAQIFVDSGEYYSNTLGIIHEYRS